MDTLKPILITLFCAFLVFSCQKHGNVEIQFTQTVDDKPVQTGQLIYLNAAGNLYQVDEVKYFVSRILLKSTSGKTLEITQDNGIHYVDNGISKTLRWLLSEIPQGEYSAISFVFGLDEEDNKSNRFVNPPECNFSWPEVLGGGYHYMQINGKFLNNNGDLQNMNIHTGIGQIRGADNEILQFVHNYFRVTLPVHFSVMESNTTLITLNMEIQRWFDSPNLYNFNDFGPGIMQNQQAQQILKENGKNVFEVMINGFL